MENTLKIAIPMAGYGTRLRPHTWSKPKPLIPLAGKTILDYVLRQFETLPDPQNVEYILIVGASQRQHIEDFIRHNYPDICAHFVVQETMRGQSDALWQARQYLNGPMLMVFSDTLVDVDFSVLTERKNEGIAWVKEVDDPTRFGVAQVNASGQVTHLIEKPKDTLNKMAVVGFYYFPSAEDLLAAIQTQFDQKITLKNEYFLADAINILLDRGLYMRPVAVNVWLDAGTTDSLLATNRYLLANGSDNSAEAARRPGVTIIPPVYVDPEAQVQNVVLGPHVSIGRGCTVKNVIARNTIMDENANAESLILEDSLLGRNASAVGQADCLNLGDDAWATI